MKDLIKRYLLRSIIITMVISSMISCGPAISYQPPINDPILFSEANKDQISLLTYNIQAIFRKDKSKLDALVNYINKEGYDFIVLQEVFDEKTREYILSKIDRNAFKSIVSRVDYNSFPELLFQDAGLFMLSKYPQVNLAEISFDDEVKVSDGALHMILTKELSITTDFLANKSVVGSLYQITGDNYLFLFNTHVQAISSIRQKKRQYKQIKNFIDYAVYAVLKSGIVESSDNLMVILSGDFSSDAYNEKELTRLLTDLGSPRELHREKHPGKEEYTMIFESINMYTRVDYILAYDKIMNFPLKKVEAQSINVTDVQNENQESVSDHLALKASLVFNDAMNEKKHKLLLNF